MSAIRISHPGRAPYLLPERDPDSNLTPWQQRVVHAVRGRNGNRSKAAEDLGTSVVNVQYAIARAKERGARVPAGARRGRDRGPRPQRPNVYREGVAARGDAALALLEQHDGDLHAAAAAYGLPMLSFAFVVSRARRRAS